ncbi:MAG: hypothetical protein GY754_33810 [bacterium]|nr:hypothetical protein [bacterium]
MKNKNIRYEKNSNLVTIKKDYPGNPLVNNRFINEEEVRAFSSLEVIKWKVSKNPQQEEKDKDQFALAVVKNNNFFNSPEDMIVWLGQATFFIRIGGKTILTDPCLTHPPFVKRHPELPCVIEDIKNIDYLLVSHNHFDHLDADSLKRLDLKNTLALLPLRLGKTVLSINKRVTIQEAGWYQQYNSNDENIEIYLMPTKHFSKRSLFDQNQSLWGSFIIKTKKRCVFFAGDMAYSANHFNEIHHYFPNIDICLMSIDSYAPQYINKYFHVTPSEAVDAFNKLKGKYFIPMHYGTFDATNEPMGEPIKILRDLDQKNTINGTLKVLDIGEIFPLTSSTYSHRL